jgi:RNA polymerase sigma-70 factor, ECF subfamily
MNNAKHIPHLEVHPMERAITPHDDVVPAAQAGSPTAFAELHAIYSERLYRAIIAITKSPEDAEDVLQETFLRAYLGIHTFEGRSSVYSWLTRIAVNSALMMLRKRRSRPEILFDPQPDALTETICFEPKDPAPSPEQDCCARQRLARLSHAIRNLSEHLREPIRMQMADGSSVKEIGRALNISEGAVKARLYRARLRLSCAGDGKAQLGY